MQTTKPRSLALLPAYNEESAISKMIIVAQKHVHEVVVVDDGSSDMTAIIAKKLGAKVLTHSRRLGKGAALRTGFKYAIDSDIDILVTLDADGQHDPSQIPDLIAALKDRHADVVVGCRQSRPIDMPLHRWLGKRALDMASQVKIGDRVVDVQSGFKAYSKRAITSLVAAEYGMGAESEILMRAHRGGMKIVEVPVNMHYAGLETSSHNPLSHYLDVSFSILKFISIRHPLTFYGGFGFAALIIGLIFGFMTLDYYQQWGRVITNLALVSIAATVLGFLSLFTGILLFTLITVVREQER